MSESRKPLTGKKIGKVVSDRQAKTRTVAVEYQIVHPKYRKSLHRQSRHHVHDQEDQSRVGDSVEIARCRPISKKKSWRLVRVVERALGGENEQTQPASEVDVDTPTTEQ